MWDSSTGTQRDIGTYVTCTIERAQPNTWTDLISLIKMLILDGLSIEQPREDHSSHMQRKEETNPRLTYNKRKPFMSNASCSVSSPASLYGWRVYG